MDYTTERSARGGFRFNVQNPPDKGAKLIHTDGRVLTFDGIGMAGMLECTDCNGIQSLLFPHQIAGPFVEAFPIKKLRALVQRACKAVTVKTMKPPTIIGLTGYAGTGKDTVRELLCTNHGFEGMAFADPIRMMLRELLLSNGITDAWMQDRQLKEAVIPALGVSYRHMAQTLGTEWGRSLHPDFWTRTAGAYIDDANQQPGTFNASFVVSDVRFANEAQWVRERGGVIWRVERSAAVPVRAHASEAEIYHIHADAVVDNNGSIDDLQLQVSQLLNGATA